MSRCVSYTDAGDEAPNRVERSRSPAAQRLSVLPCRKRAQGWTSTISLNSQSQGSSSVSVALDIDSGRLPQGPWPEQPTSESPDAAEPQASGSQTVAGRVEDMQKEPATQAWKFSWTKVHWSSDGDIWTHDPCARQGKGWWTHWTKAKPAARAMPGTAEAGWTSNSTGDHDASRLWRQ